MQEDKTSLKNRFAVRKTVLSVSLTVILSISMVIPTFADDLVESQPVSDVSITSDISVLNEDPVITNSMSTFTPAEAVEGTGSDENIANNVAEGETITDDTSEAVTSEGADIQESSDISDMSETVDDSNSSLQDTDSTSNVVLVEGASADVSDSITNDTSEAFEENITSEGLGDGEPVKVVQNDIAVSESGTVRTITILNPEAGVTSMQAAVWSDAGGQDDLKWFEMDKQGDGSFSVPVSVGNLRHSGKCYVHVYSGSKFINGAIFTVSASEMAAFKLRVEGSGGSRTVILPISYAGSGLRAALWSDAGGQDDLKWHDMVLQSDGTWTVKVSVSDFIHSGECIVHVYSDSGFVDGNTFEITAEELAAFKLSITGSDGKRKITLPAGYSVSGLKAAVWSETGGQDDLKWIDMSKQTDGSWAAEVSAEDMLHPGKCIVHVYSGSRFIDGNTFVLKDTEVKAPELSIRGENGTRTLLLVGGPSNYNNLRAAVWSNAGGQDDLKWYDVTKRSDGTWAADISAAYLKHGGECYAHVYSGNTFVGGLAFNMTAEEVNSFAFKISGTGGTRLLTVGGAYTGLPSLRVAVWSETDGQGDLKWYNATRQADGTWLVNISVSVLLNGGTINVHGYTGNIFQFAMTFNLSDAEFDAAVQEKTHAYANSVLSATGGTLRGAYNWAVNSIAYQSLVIPLTVPTSGKYAGFTRQELYFIYAFEQHLGDCFCYAASVFWCAKELGYTARLMEGMYNSASHGRPMPHGWVEIDMDGTTYFLDPEWEMQSRMNCYMVAADPLPLRRDLLAY